MADTAAIGLARTSAGSTPRAPWPVITAFYLWWVVIAAQSIGLAWNGFAFAQAARIGGPAWDILFVYGPVVLLTLIATVLEIVFVVRLRRGSRAARVWLLVLAIPAAASVTMILSNVWWATLAAASSVGFMPPAGVMNPSGFWTVVVALFLVAITAGILPFIRPVGRFFWKAPPAAPGQDGGSPGPAAPPLYGPAAPAGAPPSG
jgi:hypothetical protein